MSSICITDILHRLHLVLDFDISLYVFSVSYVLVLTRLQIVLLPSSLPLFMPCSPSQASRSRRPLLPHNRETSSKDLVTARQSLPLPLSQGYLSDWMTTLR